MRWKVEFRPEVEGDVGEALGWYEGKRVGLGAEFVEEVIKVWDALEINPFLNSRRHPTKNVRWRYPERFPYRVIYEVDEGGGSVLVLAVLHAARHDRHWRARVD